MIGPSPGAGSRVCLPGTLGPASEIKDCWEEERGRAVAQKPGMCQGPEKEEEEDGQGEDNQRRKKEHQKRL